MAKSCSLLAGITESNFADNAALYASSCEGFEVVVSSFVKVESAWSFSVSLVNSKGMVAGVGADAAILSLVQMLLI